MNWVASKEVSDNDMRKCVTRYQENNDPEELNDVLSGCAAFVVNEVMRVPNWKTHGKDDLIMMGFMGLITAAQKYDAEKGCNFLTYAGHWVRQKIKKEMHQNYSGPYISRNYYDKMIKLLGIENWEDFTNKELAKKLSCRESTVVALKACAKKRVQLDDHYSESPNEDLMDNSVESPFECCSNEDDIRYLREAMDSLSERKRYVLNARFMEDKNLQAIGEEIGLCGERVRQIELEALDDLRKFMAA